MSLTNKYIACVLAVFALSGCDTVSKLIKPDVPPKDAQEQYPANLIIRCPDIPILFQETVNMGDLVKYTTNLMDQYNDCAIKHDSLIKIIEKNGTTSGKSE